MALFHVFSEVENRNTGVPMSGVQIRVRFAGVDTLAPIYMDEAGTPFTPPNYCVTDADGMYSFYVDSGEYDLDFLVGSQVIKTIPNYRPAEVGPTGPANSTYTTTNALENADVANVSGILSESGKAGTFTIRNYVDFTAEVTADTGKINYIRSISDPTKVWVRTSILSVGAAQTGAASGLTVDAELAAKATLTGVARTATNLGTFTGSTIPDNVAIKSALQAVETAVENTTGNAATKANATAIGVAATDANMGTYTGATIPDNQTAKQNLQSLETAVEGRVIRTVLQDTTNTTGGALVGMNPVLTYPADTVGAQVMDWQVRPVSRLRPIGGSAWPLMDLTCEWVQYGTQLSPIVPDAGANFATPFMRAAYLGAGHKGGMQVGFFFGEVRGAPDPSTTNQNYVAVQTNMAGVTNVGGSSPNSFATAKGAIFGAAFNAVLYPGATSYLNVTGCEFNVSAQAGSSVFNKSIIQVVVDSPNAVQGVGYDRAIAVTGKAGAVAMKVGISFDAGSSINAVSSAGTLIGAYDSGSYAFGIDFRNSSFSNSAFASPNFTVSGTGDITSKSLTVPFANPNITLGLTGTASTNSIYFRSSGATSGAYDSALLGAGGDGSLGGGALLAHCSVLRPNNATGTTNLGGAGNVWNGIFGNYLNLTQATPASIATPASGTQNLVVSSSDNRLYLKNSSGVSTLVGVPVDTGVGGVGTTVTCQNTSGATIASSGTTDGANLTKGYQTAAGAWTAGTTFNAGQTWRNVSGIAVPNLGIASFQRIS